MSMHPARIVGIAGQGLLEVGYPANIVVFDPTGSAETGGTLSRSSNSPYLGLDLKGAVVHTMFRGNFTTRDRATPELTGVGG
jgi:dihydroorotase